MRLLSWGLVPLAALRVAQRRSLYNAVHVKDDFLEACSRLLEVVNQLCQDVVLVVFLDWSSEPINGKTCPSAGCASSCNNRCAPVGRLLLQVGGTAVCLHVLVWYMAVDLNVLC